MCPESVTVEVAVCVWLTTIASALPPVSYNVSNAVSLPSIPTITRPAPNDTQVPKPNKVAWLVATAACVYIVPTGNKAALAAATAVVIADVT